MPDDDALTKSMRRRFQYYDKDGDGRLDAAEVLTMLGDQHVSEENRIAIGGMLDSLGSVDFDEFVGLWEMVTGFESNDDESEPDLRQQDEKPAPTPEPEQVPEASTPPRDTHRTPPPRNPTTPPRKPAAAAGETASSAAQLQRPPPLPGPSSVRTRPTHPPKPRAKSPPEEAAEQQPQVRSAASRTRMLTAVSEKQLEIAGNAGLAGKQEELQRAKKKKKKNQGGGCCAARPKKGPPSSPEMSSRPAVPDPVMPDSAGSSNFLHVEDSPRALDEPFEQPDRLEREQSVPAEVDGWEAPVEPQSTPVEPTASAMEPAATPVDSITTPDAQEREDTSPVGQDRDEQWQDGQQSDSVLLETQPALARTQSTDFTPQTQRTGSSWTRNPTPPRSRPGARNSFASHQDEVEDALTQAQAAKDYAEQMIEAAHLAQAEAVQVARKAAAVHATSEARANAQQLLDAAHAVSQLCCHCQVARLGCCVWLR
jgi:hypothetical protein